VIAIDTSALMAVLLGETGADAVGGAIGDADSLHMSATNIAEAFIVAGRRGLGEEMSELIDGLGIAVDAPSFATARRVAEAYGIWGRGQHPAGLNVGDCFAYELATRLAAPLLFVGDDFSRTDVRAAI
jgi:ribonuclease VapC